jgi:afadin
MSDSVLNLIEKWNESRLDLFAIKSHDPQKGEFYGVIRFYHKDQGEKVATKCIRVASTATTQECG